MDRFAPTRLRDCALRAWRRSACAATLAALLWAAPAAGQDVKLTPFGGRSYQDPLHVTGVPDDPSRVFVVEGAGRVWLVKNGVTEPVPFLDISEQVLDLREEDCPCGMFSMAPAPDYRTSGRFYVFYTRDEPEPPDGAGFIRIDEFRRAAGPSDVADPATQRRVLGLPRPAALTHFGGQLAFGPDGHLYASLGDTGVQPLARSLESPFGKILRFDPRGAGPGQYSVPPGNPFADGAGPNFDEIYAYGLRNPYRFSFDRATGDLAIGDVGHNAYEEIEFMEEGTGGGADFGWHCYEGSAPRPGPPPGCESPPPSPTPPALEYAHRPSGAVSVISGVVVRDPSLPALAGRLLYGDSSGGLGDQIRSALVTPTGSADDRGTGLLVPGLVSFGQDACGHVYAASIVGAVSRIDPAQSPLTCKPAPVPAVRAARSVKPGHLSLLVSCDEDCDALASARVAVKRTRSKKGFKMGAGGVPIRLQAGREEQLKLTLASPQAGKLRRALKGGRRASWVFSVSATGGGGGTEEAEGRLRLSR